MVLAWVQVGICGLCNTNIRRSVPQPRLGGAPNQRFASAELSQNAADRVPRGRPKVPLHGKCDNREHQLDPVRPASAVQSSSSWSSSAFMRPVCRYVVSLSAPSTHAARALPVCRVRTLSPGPILATPLGPFPYRTFPNRDRDCCARRGRRMSRASPSALRAGH